MSCVFSQSPREKDRLRPAARRVSASLRTLRVSAFRKSFVQRTQKDFPNLPKKTPLGTWEQPFLAPLREGVLRDHSGTTKEIKIMQTQTSTQSQFINTVTQGNCIQVMAQMPTNCVDFILTDPPYLVNYRDREGRTTQSCHGSPGSD
jgi:Tfp pilus assembly protein FimT